MPVGILVISGFLFFGATAAQAQETNAVKTSLIQRIAQKFNLKEADVKTVFDQHHSERQAEMQKKVDEKLTQAVKDGKITEAQKQLIVAKHKEMQTQFESQKETMKDMTPEQRKTAMEAQKKSLQDWATQNNIDIQYLMKGIGMKGRGHMK